jgi:hypothetical protein
MDLVQRNAVLLVVGQRRLRLLEDIGDRVVQVVQHTIRFRRRHGGRGLGEKQWLVGWLVEPKSVIGRICIYVRVIMLYLAEILSVPSSGKSLKLFYLIVVAKFTEIIIESFGGVKAK